MSQKKKSRRSACEFPALEPAMSPKARWEVMDHDYIHKLSPEEKRWLNNFEEEYTHASFNHDGKKLHRTKKQRKLCYDRNNARNRDMYAIFRTRGWVETEELLEDPAHPDPEALMIERLDSEKRLKLKKPNRRK
jgi:hypothetical protein